MGMGWNGGLMERKIMHGCSQVRAFLPVLPGKSPEKKRYSGFAITGTI
jgi:hypothetical protein